MRYLLVALAVAVQASALQRSPLQRRNITLRSPATYERRVLRYDPKSGQPIYYDPRPRVVPLNARTGKYGLKWIGYDGKEKVVVYQRPDAIDAVVAGSVSRAASDRYLYTYNIRNLKSSIQHLSGFAVQTFAADAKATAIGSGYVGLMSKNEEMKHGTWIYFGASNFGDNVTPGREVELKLISSAPPGLVECRVTGGNMTMIGVNEEPPHELESVLPRYEIWPRGYTVGPNANLTSLSAAERLTDVRLWLPQFQRLGWMTPSARRWYEQNLTPDRLGLLRERAERDLKAGTITTEVHAIIQAIR